MAATFVPRQTFPSAPQSIAAVRRFVENALKGHPRQDDAVLVADELATNAYQHTPTLEFTVTVYRDRDGVFLVVGADPGDGDETGRPKVFSDGVFGRDGDETGRGLFIVTRLAAEWGCGMVNGHQAVYAVLHTPAPVPAPLVAVAK